MPCSVLLGVPTACFSLPGTECGVRGTGPVPQFCRGTCSALPPLPAALPAPTGVRVREGLQAQGASRDVRPKEGVAVLCSAPDGEAARCFPHACSRGADPQRRRSGPREAGLLAEALPSHRSRGVCAAVGPAVTVAAGAGLGAFGRASVRPREGAASRMSSDPTAGHLRAAPAPAHGRHSLSLFAREACTRKGSWASSLILGGKALVLARSRVAQAQAGEGVLLRGAMCAGTLWASHPDFFLTGRPRDLASGVHTRSEVADRLPAHDGARRQAPGAEPAEAGPLSPGARRSGRRRAAPSLIHASRFAQAGQGGEGFTRSTVSL